MVVDGGDDGDGGEGRNIGGDGGCRCNGCMLPVHADGR